MIILTRKSNEFYIHESLRSNERVTLNKTPQYTLFPLRLVKIWRDNLHYSSSCDLVFRPFVRRGSVVFVKLLFYYQGLIALIPNCNATFYITHIGII
jgi:hypothetical protein